MFNPQGDPQNQQLPTSNIILAMVLIGVLYMAYMFLTPRPEPTLEEAATQVTQAQVQDAAPINGVMAFLAPRYGKGATLPIASGHNDDDLPAAVGEIDESSAVFTNLTLNDYAETLKSDQRVSVFNFDGLQTPYPYLLQPIIADDVGGADRDQTPEIFRQVEGGEGLTLEGQSGDLVTQITYTTESEHLYRVRLTATNRGEGEVDVSLGARLLRGAEADGTVPGVQSIWTARQGLAYYDTNDNRVRRQAYNQIVNTIEDERIPQSTGDGWIAFADKYFMTALIPTDTVTSATSYHYIEGSNAFTARILNTGQGITTELDPGEQTSFEFLLFAGPKELSLLQGYQNDREIEQFVYTIDFGWFWYFTLPFTMALAWLGGAFGNVGVAILIITIIIKAFLFPLANNSYRSMARMKKLQPKMQALREKHGEDRQAMSQATMALYREEGANPVAGCLPMLVQIPIFFALYKVIFNTLEIRHKPFFGWVQDMSVGDPTSWMNLFGILPYDLPAFLAAGGILGFLSIGVWPILMGLTMFWQQRLSPAPTDATQAMIMRFLPLIFTFFMAAFPAGLVIYWTWNNFLSVLQQMFITRGAKTGSEEKKEAEIARAKEKAAAKKQNKA